MNQDIYDKLTTPIPIDQVEFRVQSISPKGWATLLAYKDARVDINRLNSVIGQGNWQRKHEIIDGNLYCSVGIYTEGIGWAWVQDVGTESNTEKEKGQASDSFKRACFNLGIGLELYDYPLILVELKKNEYETWKDKSSGKMKAKQTYDLKVKEWKWEADFNGSKVMSLRACDQKGGSRYQFPRNWTKQPAKTPPATQKPNPAPKQETRPLEYKELFAMIVGADSMAAVRAVRPLIDQSKAANMLDAAKLSQLTECYKDRQIQLKAGDNG